MSFPVTPVEPPAAVATIAAGRPSRCVWRNGIGGLTFQIRGDGDAREFVKWQPRHPLADLAAEARRLRWAIGFTTVPRVLGTGGDATATWLHTAGLPGESAVAARWHADPRGAARAVGRGLRMLHDAVPVERCPFDWSPATRLPRLATESGRPVEELRRALGPPPPVDRLVVCHGDPCVPNTLLAEDGEVTGHVDLGALGVADRWADLAVASWSTVWNFGPGYEVPLLAAYGVEADPVRIAYYRALWGESPAHPG
jgi:aminoglycoside phosphotransferase